MRRKIGELLICPNSGDERLKFYALELVRDGKVLKGISDDGMMPDDDIKLGIAISESSPTAFPIDEFVGVFLADEDVDIHHHSAFFSQHAEKLPDAFKQAVHQTMQRIVSMNETSDGKWNREEMRYYDAEVDTVEKREKMLDAVFHKPVWRIFIPRKKSIIDVISPFCRNKYVLEIGGGVCRTVCKMFNPEEYHFNNRY
jgi:hypothetical protein